MSKMDVHFSSESSEWATPADFFALLDDEYRFTLDVCASAENAKVANYFDKEQNALTQAWTGVWFMNPPYGDPEMPCPQPYDKCTKKRCQPPSEKNPKGRGYHIDEYIPGIADWVQYAYGQSAYHSSVGVCLLPARTDTDWWHRYVMRAKELRFVNGRITFEGGPASAPFPSVVAVFDAHTAAQPIVSSLFWRPGRCVACELPIVKGAYIHPSCKKEFDTCLS